MDFTIKNICNYFIYILFFIYIINITIVQVVVYNVSKSNELVS